MQNNYTVLDELLSLVSADKDIIFLNRDHTSDQEIYQPCSNATKKIIIITSIGDTLDLYTYKNLLDRDLEIFQRTGKLNNFYIVVSAEVPDTLVEQYKDILHYCYMPSIYAWYKDKLSLDQFSLNKDIKKIFLSLNNRAMWSRQALFYTFLHHGLLDKSYFSYLMSNPLNLDSPFETTNSDGAGEYLTKFGLDPEVVQKLIPYSIDFDRKKGSDWSYGDCRFYNETFCSVITETYVHKEFFTEKTFKAFAFNHPFLLVGASGSLNYLKSIGFETFSNIFNEEYDFELNQLHRFDAMCAEILNVSTWSIAKCIDVTKKIQPLLDHNKNNLLEYLPKRYDLDVNRLIIEIQELVKLKKELFY
jgi:hypothetical protein